MELRSIVSAISIAIFILAYLVIHFYPSIPRSIAGWTVLIFLGLPALIFIETMGEKILGAKFFRDRSGVVRIMLGVPTVIVLSAITIGIVAIVYHTIGSVGG